MTRILYEVYHQDEPEKLLAYVTRDINHSGLKLTTTRISVEDDNEASELIQSCFLAWGSGCTTSLERYLWDTIEKTKNPETIAAAFVRVNEIILSLDSNTPTPIYAADSAIGLLIEIMTEISQITLQIDFNEETGIFSYSGPFTNTSQELLSTIFSWVSKEAKSIGANYPLQIQEHSK